MNTLKQLGFHFYMLAAVCLLMITVACTFAPLDPPVISGQSGVQLRVTTSTATSVPTATDVLTPRSATRAATATPSPTQATSRALPAFDHIFIIVDENHSYSDLIGNKLAPYINQLAAENGLAANYRAITNPSLPNYLALLGGSTFGVSSDCITCFVNAQNLTDEIEASGRTWKGYMESMPSSCFVGDYGLGYAQKHDPFMYFDNIRTNPARCNQVVPLPRLASDLSSSATTPNLVWITPNVCNDMHYCGVILGDLWLHEHLPHIFKSPAWTNQNSLLLLTWDEGAGLSNQVATLVVGRSVKAGYRSQIAYDHYSLLHTVESLWGLAPLTSNDASAIPMNDFWN